MTGGTAVVGDIIKESVINGIVGSTTIVRSRSVALIHTQSINVPSRMVTTLNKVLRTKGINKTLILVGNNNNLGLNKILHFFADNTSEESKPDGHYHEYEVNNKKVLYCTNFDFTNVVTPVNVENLEKLGRASGYDEDKLDLLIDGFKNGFDLGYEGPQKVVRTAPNLPFKVRDEIELWNKVMKEVKLKCFAGPFAKSPFKYYIQSPIGLVPKDGGRDTRLIFHLSYPKNGSTSVNANTPKDKCKVKYPDFSDAIKLCIKEGKFCHLSRSDLKSAFRNLGISKKYWKYLLMKARNPFDKLWYIFVDKCLPFGAGISCALFQSFSNCVAHMAAWKANQDRKIVNYLDDYLFAALLKIWCNGQVHAFLEVCEMINFPVSQEKTFWADTRMVFLGFLIDTVRQVVCVPQEKIAKAINMINYALGKKNLTILELQKICGFLNFLSRAVVPGRTFTRRLYSHINPKLKQHHHVKLNSEMRMDLNVWAEFLKHPSVFCRPFMDFDVITADDLQFYTDATANPRLGFGAWFNNSYMYSRWNFEFMRTNKPSIQYLELFAIAAAVVAWMDRFQNRRVAIFTDNKAVKSMINFMTSSCKNCMILIRIIVLYQMIHNVRLYAKHVASEDNGPADDLSRMRIRKCIRDKTKKGITLDQEPTMVPDLIWPIGKIWIDY